MCFSRRGSSRNLPLFASSQGVLASVCPEYLYASKYHRDCPVDALICYYSEVFAEFETSDMNWHRKKLNMLSDRKKNILDLWSRSAKASDEQ